MSIFWSMRRDSGSTANLQAAEAKSAARSAKTQVQDMEARLDRAMLACEAMWTILRDKLGVTDVELADRINKIDLSDGQLDGKARKGAVACPKCHRTISPRFPQCMYCGQPIVQDPFA